MIRNKNPRQVDLTRDDLDILLGLRHPCEPRKHDRQDAMIMRAHAGARLRGATPADVLRTVMSLWEAHDNA